MEGVCAEVAAKMAEVGATVSMENGLLMRSCEHGIRHPCGHLAYGATERAMRDGFSQHHGHRKGKYWQATCDGCCEVGAIVLAELEAARLAKEAELTAARR